METEELIKLRSSISLLENEEEVVTLSGELKTKAEKMAGKCLIGKLLATKLINGEAIFVSQARRRRENGD